MPASRHRVVVVGSGFGGLFATKVLRDVDCDVTVIDRATHHLFQPLLYQVATGILSEGEIAPPVRDVLRHQENAAVLLGEVVDVDLDARIVTSRVLDLETVTPYDSLIVATGARTSYFGHDEFARHAPGLKSIDDALEIRGRILSAFEYAELEEDPTARQEWLTFAVIGAGATGVEMAGQISELARRTLVNDYRGIDPRDARILLIDAMDDVLGTFGTKLSAGAARQLEKMGIDVWLSEKVVDLDDTSLTVEDRSGTRTRIPARTIIWAAGVKASPLAESLAQQSGAELDRGGRVKVGPDCSLPGHPEVFVIGDMMSLNDYPGVAQVAMQQGKYAADQIRRRLHRKPDQKPFHYFDKGSMATISRFRAVANVGSLRFGGFIAWVLWLIVHVMYLVGFKNRLTTVLHWAVSFIGRGRSQRTTTYEQVNGRRRLQRAERAAEDSEQRAAARR
jgi:NADH dehydrogenase